MKCSWCINSKCGERSVCELWHLEECSHFYGINKGKPSMKKNGWKDVEFTYCPVCGTELKE